tara:strand:- start:69 stop:1037 length:969 start_codon:yes stop_codon:yes gene_type:complete
MATYKEIRGTQIEAVATDPSNPVEGQVWYNTTSNVLKGNAATAAGAWATGGTLNTARYGGGSAGIQTAALYFGGITVPPVTAVVESYNGTSWTEVNDLNTGRTVTGAGTNTSALAFGGSPPITGKTESWNGTNWTEVNDLNTARWGSGGAGADNTACLAFGGETPPTTAVTETWNGTNWTEVNDLNTARHLLAGCGINTAALAIAGHPARTINETWNGTNWTEVADLNTGRHNLAAAGTTTNALAFGGYDGTDVTAVVELWNGSNWTETTNLSVARYGLGGAGTYTSALGFGGIKSGSPNVANNTEEWTGAGAPLVRTFTDS